MIEVASSAERIAVARNSLDIFVPPSLSNRNMPETCDPHLTLVCRHRVDEKKFSSVAQPRPTRFGQSEGHNLPAPTNNMLVITAALLQDGKFSLVPPLSRIFVAPAGPDFKPEPAGCT